MTVINSTSLFTGYKYGTCPYRVDYGAIGRYCSNDYSCPGYQKCCHAYGSYRCQIPIEYSRPGSCYYSQGSVGTSSCTVDSECYYGQKCCAGYGGNFHTCKYVYGRTAPYTSAPLFTGGNLGLGSSQFVNPGVNTFPGVGVLPGAFPGAFPGGISGAFPGANPGFLPGANPGILPGAPIGGVSRKVY